MLIKSGQKYEVGQAVQHFETGELGKVVQKVYTRYLVTWDRDGKTFIYPAVDLLPA